MLLLHFFYVLLILLPFSFFFFFNDTATTEIYTLSYTTLFRSLVPVVLHRDHEHRLGAIAVPLVERPVDAVLHVGREEVRVVDHQRLARDGGRSEEHTSELQSPCNLVCRLLLEKKK